eukprot:TRINITY_DN75470_c0_g1_i1.p1 TRINITY_DN75470_c0_g1~~TRINITY_DN75470_c0_g1_i1.p1  ORF type:complete len:429 (+),score=53.86 TRINITY_DN75470_c0_g1_i1:87-1373(+)
MSSHADFGVAGKDFEESLVTSAAAQEAGLESGSSSEEAKVSQMPASSGRWRIGIAFGLVGAAAIAASVAFVGRGGRFVGEAAQGWQEDGIVYAEPEVVKDGPFEDEFTELYNTQGYNPSSANYYGKPVGTSSSSSSYADCILCSPNQCTVDYSGRGHWASCPATAKYFSKSLCGCVSSMSQCTGKQPSCSQLCAECYSKSCYGNGKYNKCGRATPYYMATRNQCASSCSPAPGPAPQPQWGSQSVGPAPGPYNFNPAAAPYGSKPPAPAPYGIAPYTGGNMPSTGGMTPSTSSGECNQDTGGRCMLTNCDASRGKTDCKDRHCVCKKGYCADKNGICVAAGSIGSSSSSSDTGYPRRRRESSSSPRRRRSMSSSSTQQCKAETGGSCMFTNCASSRGQGVECKSRSCVCKKGYCADSKGVCKQQTYTR